MGRTDPNPAWRPQSRDTDPWAERLLFDHWRKMATQEKAALVSQLSRSLHALSLAGLRARFPGATTDELERRAAELRLGPQLYAWVQRKIEAE